MSVLLSVGETNKDLYRRNWTDLLFNEREIPNGGAVRWKHVFEFGEDLRYIIPQKLKPMNRIPTVATQMALRFIQPT